MSKIIAYLFNNELVEVFDEKEIFPLNTNTLLTEDYDFIDKKGNKILVNRKFEYALSSLHEKRLNQLREQVNTHFNQIQEIETKSQTANNQEYQEYSEKIKEHSEKIDDLNLKMYLLNKIYNEKINRLTPDIVYTDFPRTANPSPQITDENPTTKKVRIENEIGFKPVGSYPAHRFLNTPAVPSTSGIIQQMGTRITNVKGWDKEAVDTVQNWRVLYKEYKYIYEWILERNYRISTNLNLISVVSSSMMGCFSAFKLWIQDDRTFQATSDIIMLFSNFLIAAITTSSKRYIDDNRNEKIRTYLEEVNKFLGTISSELIKSPEYRMEADKFIESQQEIYSKLSTNKPNISISELTESKKAYKSFMDSFSNFSSNETQTDPENQV